MTPDDFRQTALALPGAMESSHMGHPDFRAHGRIFATLFSPDEAWGMVKLNADEQAELCAADPKMFRPVPGGWGRMGCTNVRLDMVTPKRLEYAMRLAFDKSAVPSRRAVAAKPTKKLGRKRK